MPVLLVLFSNNKIPLVLLHATLIFLVNVVQLNGSEMGRHGAEFICLKCPSSLGLSAQDGVGWGFLGRCSSPGDRGPLWRLSSTFSLDYKGVGMNNSNGKPSSEGKPRQVRGIPLSNLYQTCWNNFAVL